MQGKTIGEKRIRVDLSATAKDHVTAFKQKTAELMNELESIKSVAKLNVAIQQEDMAEIQRLCQIAQTQLETASMYMTKALTV